MKSGERGGIQDAALWRVQCRRVCARDMRLNRAFAEWRDGRRGIWLAVVPRPITNDQ
jgi:hypothetical protein